MFLKIWNFVSRFILGILFCLSIFLIFEWWGIFKESWKPDFSMIGDSATLAAYKFSNSPNYKDIQHSFSIPTAARIFIPSIQETLYERPNIDINSFQEGHKDGLKPSMFGPLKIDIVISKLNRLQETHPACPPQSTTYWTECYGEFEFPWGDVYSGLWEKDELYGIVRIKRENGDLYLGNFAKNRYHGCGILLKSNGSEFSGLWKNGEFKTKVDTCEKP